MYGRTLRPSRLVAVRGRPQVGGLVARSASLGLGTVVRAARAASASLSTQVQIVGADPYSLYPALDKALIPPHAGAGAYGPQRSVAECSAPVVSTSVTVTTWAQFQSAMLAGGRTITIGADINGNGGVIGGHVTDVDVIIPPGRVLRSFYMGQFNAGHLARRVRFRGNTVGTHSGGQLHHIQTFTSNDELVFDGIDMTGPGVLANPSPPPPWIQQAAIILNAPSVNNRVAFNQVRGMCGNYFFIGEVNNLVVTASSFFTGAEPRQSSGVEGWVFRVIGQSPNNGLHVFFHNDFRGTRFHKLRLHPDGSGAYCWIDSNYFVDMNEARLLTANSAMVTSPKGYFAGLWATNNESWTDINDPPNAGPDFSCGSAAYVRMQGNVFHSDEITSDASLNVNDIEGLIPDASQNWLKSGNSYGPMAAEPAYRSSTPGSPTGLAWNLGN